MGLFKEFKEFAVKGNVIDLAVGLVIGAAFGEIVKSLVNDIITPPIGLVISNIDFSSLAIELPKLDPNKPAVVIAYGKFINALISFLIAAFAMFIVIKQINRLKRREAAAPSDPTTKVCDYCQTTIPIKAVRCPNCTSELAAAK
jgi:large conductance mechanosensitive channel